MKKTILGLEIENKKADIAATLPLYISGNYNIEEVTLAGTDCVLLEPVDAMGTVDSISKHISKVRETSGLPVAVYTENLTAFRRDSFIKKRVPFLTDKQAYLPFLGTYLESIAESGQHTDTLTAAAQVTLLRWLYAPAERVKVVDLMKDLGYTAMTISRVAKQLAATECFDLEKDGAANVLVAKYDARKTFKIMSKYMMTPASGFGYMDLPAEGEFLVAGVEAVSERTMLASGKLHTYAAYKLDKRTLRSELIDPERQAYVEIWKYNPKLLTWKDGFADPISVALSLRENNDERVRAAVNDMLEDVWK